MLMQNLQMVEFNPNAYTPFIMLTANPSEDADEIYSNAGFADYIKKPLTSAVLEDIMRRFLKLYKKPKAEEQRKVENGISQSAGGSAQVQSMGGAVFTGGVVTELPVWLKNASGIDTDIGVRMNGSVFDYFESLKIFKRESKTISEQLQQAYDNNDIENYRILVHSLKSSATIIGAIELASYAEEIEDLAIRGIWEDILQKHMVLMVTYQGLTGLLYANIYESNSPDGRGSAHSSVEKIEKNVCIFSNDERVLLRAIENHLNNAGFVTHRGITATARAEVAMSESSLLVCFTEDIDSDAGFLKYLQEVGADHDKGIMVVGSPEERQHITELLPGKSITGYHEKPLDMENLIKDVKRFYDNYETRSRRKHRILLVDDDVMYTDMSGRWLSEYYDLDIANSGIEAISSANKKKPDLILLDYEMPITDGAEFFEIIRSDESMSGIPVIFLTGSRRKSSVMRILDLKPEGYLLKDIDKNSLIEKIDEFFRDKV